MSLLGSTIKPLVNLLNVDKANEDQSTMMEELHDQFLNNLMPGVRCAIVKLTEFKNIPKVSLYSLT